MLAMNKIYYYGGGLDKKKHVYVERAADINLYENLKNGKICCVFNARKAGKTSLRNSVTDLLIADGHKCVIIDLNKIGRCEKEEDWYFSILYSITRQLEIDNFELKEWWNQNIKLTNSSKLCHFFEEQVLSRFQEQVTVFIDEVDFVKTLPFETDNLFVWIRAIYQTRSEPKNTPQYNYPNFCLIGLAKVSDLIQNSDTTSFNIGEEIELTEFKLDTNGEIPKSLQVLIIPELRAKVDNPEAVLKIVLQQTGGQPFLTLKLLSLIVKNITQQDQPDKIQQLVNSRITDNWRENDSPEYFRHIESRIMIYKERTGHKQRDELIDEQKTSRLLKLYRDILEGQEIKWDKTNDQLDLQLSGLVSNQQGILKPISQIHEKIFNLAWIDKCLEKIRPLWYQDKKFGWEQSSPDDRFKRDKVYLLYGEELKEAREKWHRLSSEDEAFIDESYKVYQNDIGALTSTPVNDFNDRQKEIIVNRIRYWTNHDKEIFDLLINTLKDLKDNDNDIVDLSIIEEEKWIDNLIQKRIILRWKNIPILNKICQQIQDKKEEKERFNLLVTYGKLLRQKIIFEQNNPEQKLLLDIGLIKKRYKKDGFYIEISNPIYRSIFNEDYINKMLPNTRGYGKKLGMWLITEEYKYMLSQEELSEIIPGLTGEKLLQKEHEYFNRSIWLNYQLLS